MQHRVSSSLVCMRLNHSNWSYPSGTIVNLTKAIEGVYHIPLRHDWSLQDVKPVH
jgi:hypothetical protein